MEGGHKGPSRGGWSLVNWVYYLSFCYDFVNVLSKSSPVVDSVFYESLALSRVDFGFLYFD